VLDLYFFSIDWKGREKGRRKPIPPLFKRKGRKEMVMWAYSLKSISEVERKRGGKAKMKKPPILSGLRGKGHRPIDPS